MKLYTRLATIINSVSARSRAVFVISWLWIIDKTLFLSLPRSIDFRSRLFELTSSLNVLLPYFQQVSLHLPPPPPWKYFSTRIPSLCSPFKATTRHRLNIRSRTSVWRVIVAVTILSFFLFTFFIHRDVEMNERKIVEISLSFFGRINIEISLISFDCCFLDAKAVISSTRNASRCFNPSCCHSTFYNKCNII